jgi:hypothetical protein
MSYSLLEAQDFALKNHLSIKNSALAIEKSEEQKKRIPGNWFATSISK